MGFGRPGDAELRGERAALGDVADQGGIDLYVERQGPPLWIQIRPAGKGFTRYTLIGALGREGAEPDSAAGGVGHPPTPGGAGH